MASQLCMLTSSYTSSLVTQGLREMYSSKTLLDLEVFDVDGNTLHAHSCVLAAVSPVLKSHLSNPGANQRIQRLCFQDISAEEWQIILDFVYLGEVIISVEQVRRMLSIVQSLEIEELLDLCKMSLEQSNILHGTPAAEPEPEPAPEDPSEPIFTESIMPVIPPQPKATPTQNTQSLIKQPSAAVLQSSRFPQHSLNPGRGSQCPYTKDGTLAKHRLAPLSTGTICGPFGTVEINTNEIATDELMKRVNKAFFGEEGGGDNCGEQPSKRQKLDDEVHIVEENDVQIKSEVQIANDQHVSNENLEEQYVYIVETGEVKTLSSLQKTEKEKGEKTKSKDKGSPIKSEKRLYKCTHCELELPFGPKLKRHENEHRAGKAQKKQDFTCERCNKEFASERALNFHIRINCSPLFKCKFCNEGFHFGYQLDEHYIKEHEEESKTMFPDEKQCDLCEETFRSETILNHHKGKTHRGWKKNAKIQEENVKCPHCDQKFKKSRELAAHVKYIHTQTSCEFCNESFENRNAMIDHLEECTDAPEGEAEKHVKKMPQSDSRKKKPVNCPHCQALFPSKAALVRHNDKEHEGRDMTYCTMCEKRFQNITAFRNHMMRHYGIRPHKCEICGRSFTEERDMIKHKQNAHGTERPHKCPHCDWSFKDVSALYGHAKRKHKVILSRNYNRRTADTVDNHTLMQLLINECVPKRQDEPTRCVVCNAKFQRRGNMYTHAKQIHGKDFNKLLKEGLRTHKMNPISETNIQLISIDDTVSEQEEEMIRTFTDEATGAEQVDIREVPSEFVENIDEQGIILDQTDLQQHCPLCSLDCGNKWGIVKHCREAHDVDLLVLGLKVEPESE